MTMSHAVEISQRDAVKQCLYATRRRMMRRGVNLMRKEAAWREGRGGRGEYFPEYEIARVLRFPREISCNPGNLDPVTSDSLDQIYIYIADTAREYILR